MPDTPDPDPAPDSGSAPTEIAVFAPTTSLSVTVESNSDAEEVHIHAAGQGFWVARMLTVLGARPVLCTPLGGEPGVVLGALLAEMPGEGFVHTATTNGAYVHDRRDGERLVVADVASRPLDRHCIDDLLSTTLACGLRAGTAVVCGSNLHANVDDEVFGRVCADLRSGGCSTVADLSGDELRAALEGGIDVLKLSHEELIAGAFATGDTVPELTAGAEWLLDHGARHVVVSRATDGVLAFVDGGRFDVQAPELTVVDPHGAGDSMTAGLAFGVATGLGWEDCLRLATAAAALNVTRHGLASGIVTAIDELSKHVTVTSC